MKENELYEKAIKKWGVDAQINMAIEEMAELIQALVKQGRAVNGCTKGEVMEEIIDVEIMLEQLKLIFFPNKSDLDFYDFFRRQKLLRLEKLLEAI